MFWHWEIHPTQHLQTLPRRKGRSRGRSVYLALPDDDFPAIMVFDLMTLGLTLLISRRDLPGDAGGHPNNRELLLHADASGITWHGHQKMSSFYWKMARVIPRCASPMLEVKGILNTSNRGYLKLATKTRGVNWLWTWSAPEFCIVSMIMTLYLTLKSENYIHLEWKAKFTKQRIILV